MWRRLLGIMALLTALLSPISRADAEIEWSYVKPGSERSTGDWFLDILGLSEFGRSYAVIIGLSRFEHFNPLDATENDPQRVFDFLRDEAGFDYILMLRDQEVTYSELRNLFEFELPRTLRSNDRFLLFWSGHGTQFPDARGSQLGYLPLVSSPLDNKATMVSMADVARWDGDLPAKQALFLLDACFSGLAGLAAQSDDRELELRELAKPGHHIISAGRSDEQTIASRQEWQGSIFTHALLQALGGGEADRFGGKDGGGDGVINLHELALHMGETVKHAKAAAGWNRPLRPVLHVFPGRGEGQFFFLTSEKKRTHLQARGMRVGDQMAYGMPIVVMGSVEHTPAQIGEQYGGRDVTVFGVIKDSSIAKDFGDFIDQFPESAFAPYARNRVAFLRQRESDTPSAGVTARSDPATLEAGLNLRPEDRRVVQEALTALNFDTRGVDGVFGANTRRAIIGWQSAAGEEPTGYLTSSQYGRLLGEAEPKLAALESARRAPAPRAQPAVGVYPEPGPPGTVFRDRLKDGSDCPYCPEMVEVPAGSFTRGSPPDEPGRDDDEGPQREVTIPRPFAVGKYEVTFAQWDACHDDGACNYKPEDEWGGGDQPVMRVNWHDAQEYVAWLGERTGKSYRLLTEAEWEYVARAGSETAYWWGDDVGSGNANCKGCGSQWDGKQTAPVGSFAANDFGLHDTAGNVWEWVQDCYHSSYDGAPKDGSAWEDGGDCRRVLRGGSWDFEPRLVRSAIRYWLNPDFRRYSYGFRVARTAD